MESPNPAMEAKEENATSPHSPGAGRSRAILLTLASLLSVLLVASILSVDYLATSDGPERIFSGYMQNHLQDAGRGYDRFLRLVPSLTDVGFETVFASLEPFLGWRLAYQVTLCFIVLLWAWGLMALAASFGQPHAWLGLLGFGTALQWSFYMGQLSFQLGTGLGFLVLALSFRRREPSLVDRVLLAALLLTQCVVHAFAAILTGAVLLLHAWLAAEPKRRLRALGSMVLVGLPAALIAVWTLARHVGNSGAGQYNYPPTSMVDRLILLARGFVSGPWWRAWPPTLLAVWVLVRPRWRTWDARGRALALAGAALALCAAFLPLHLHSWEFFSVRFTPDAIVFLMVLALPTTLPRRAQVVLVALMTVYSAAAITWSWHHHRTIRAASTDLLAGLHAPVKRTGVRLHLPLEPPPGEDRDEWQRAIPYVTTTGHVGALYAIEQGGVPAHSFAGLTGQGLAWRAPLATWMPPRPPRGFEWQLWEPKVEADPKERRAGIIHYLAYAPPFEDVILHARPSEAPLLTELGFTVDFQQGGLFLARFQGCALNLAVQPPENGPVPLLVTAGWIPQQHPVLTSTLEAPDAAGPITLTRAPCGQSWLRVLYDMDGNGVPSSGDRACAGANPAAVLLKEVRPGPEENRVTCLPGARL